MHFSNNLVVCSSAGPKILAFGSHHSANFQPILDCYISNFKLTYEDSENIKADHVGTVVCNLHQMKCRTFFGTPGIKVRAAKDHDRNYMKGRPLLVNHLLLSAE